MDVRRFVEYFNSIKPSFEEIKNLTSSISADSELGISKDFDLKITSFNSNKNPIIDLIEHTNICNTGFSVFHFYKNTSTNSMTKIGMIEEKGNIFFNEDTKLITFQELELMPYSFVNQPITQNEFLEFYLKYLELYFNRIFRTSSKTLRIINDIQLNIGTIKKFNVFKELLSEIGVEFKV